MNTIINLPDFHWLTEEGETTFRFSPEAMCDLRDHLLHAASVMEVVARYAKPGTWDHINLTDQAEALRDLRYHLGRIGATHRPKR